MAKNGFICPIAGAKVGEAAVSGDAYLQASFQYSHSHLWRNVGILLGFFIFFTFTYIAASELNLSTSGQQGAIQFISNRHSRTLPDKNDRVEDQTNDTSGRSFQDDGIDQSHEGGSDSMIFQWQDINYDVKVGGEARRLLDNLSGWVRSGSLTALMGVSGAGKTTLLDFLSGRLKGSGQSNSVAVYGPNVSPTALERIGTYSLTSCCQC